MSTSPRCQLFCPQWKRSHSSGCPGHGCPSPSSALSPAPSHCPFGGGKKREAPQLGHLCPSCEKGPLAQRRGGHRDCAGLFGHTRALSWWPGPEQAKKHGKLRPERGTWGGSQGSDEGHSPFLPTHALRRPGLAQTRGAVGAWRGWASPSAPHAPTCRAGEPPVVKPAVSSRAPGSGDSAPLLPLVLALSLVLTPGRTFGLYFPSPSLSSMFLRKGVPTLLRSAVGGVGGW